MLTCRDGEGWRVVSLIRYFDLTPCFEEGLLLSPLLVLCVVLSLFRSWYLISQDVRSLTRKSVWLLRIKLIVLTVALIASSANLAILLSTSHSVSFFLHYALEPLALSAALALTYVNHLRCRSSSTIVLSFWPLYILSLLVWVRTQVSSGVGDAFSIFSLKCLVGGSGLAGLLLECVGPEVGRSGDNDTAHESPFVTANIYSRWSFSWMTPLMQKGAATYITEDDLPSLRHKDESAKLGNDLEVTMTRQSLWLALFAAYGRPYAFAAGLKVVQDCLAFLQPQLLRWILSYISDYQGTRHSPLRYSLEGFVIAGLMFVASITQTVILHQYFQLCFETGMRVRAGLVTRVYSKALVLSSDERGRASGDIVNLMSVDATRLQDLCTYGLIVISGPLQITLAFVSLYNLLGWSAFVGVGIMIISIPLNTFMARTLKKMQEKQMTNRDTRTRLMNEILANIRSIKLYAWEFAFIRRVFHVRNSLELKMLKKIGIVTSLNTTLWTGIPLLVAFSSFAVAALTSTRPLTSDIIFPSISLFMLLQFPLAMFSQVTSNIIEALVSINRLSNFFAADELQSDARKVLQKAKLDAGDEILSISKGEFSWSREAKNPTLEDINLTVRKGELVGVLGRVGAGKTSLIAAIIGDMRRTDGNVVVSGCISYAPQNPWILSASLRENILFSHQYDEVFYNLVLDACALRDDIARLPDGDLTEVGEKGITLSGGQRARVALARAVYARADLVLLDDVLAAVDSHVARHVFDEVIGPQGLLANKARILITNGLTFLKQFDQIVFIRRGVILQCGSYNSLMTDPNGEIPRLLREHGNSATSSGMSTPFISSGSMSPKPESDESPCRSASEDYIPEREVLVHVSEKLIRRRSFQKAVLAQPTLRSSQTGTKKEHSEQGQVKWTVYLRYISAASKQGFSLFLLATVTQQIMSVLATVTLRAWGEHNRQSGNNTSMLKYLAGYGLFSASSTLFGGIAALLMWVYCTLRSAKNLHDSMLYSVMRAPLSWFELTPTGRVLNLFSRDIYVVDQILGRVIQNLIRTAAVCVSIVVVIGWSFPPFLLAIPPLAWFYIRVMRYYLATSRELKRLDAVSRSPIFAWFSESLAGLSTIRAFNQQHIFVAHIQQIIDRNQICYLPSISVNRWLAVRLEFVGAIIILITAALAITALITTGVDAGLVGLVLSYALNTTSSLNWVIRSASEVEQNIVSVERIMHYTELPSEAPDELPEDRPASTWPANGQVEFREYSARYRPELGLVLNNISMTIKPREKIGICGRTGAGKSSLLLALFRIIEPAQGTIYIDGVDITKIGLHGLRSAISIVPQSPDLFQGSMRENIDPVGEHQDADIWVALEQAHLKNFVESLPGGLDSTVQEGGSSLSAGQRQLLCFARALLRKAKILVLDEATSAVDLDTDRAIQEIIRGPFFTEMTVFTIAHRLNTIMESDRVLVLDAGKIAEFDTPDNLLRVDSMFKSLATEAGLISVEAISNS